MINPEKRMCVSCGKEFLERRSVIRTCCSKECSTKHRLRNRVIIKCIVCNKEKSVPASKANAQTCSRVCFAKETSKRQTIKNSNGKGRVKIVQCVVCGKDTKDYTGNKKFCSIDCKGKWQVEGLSGSNNPFYEKEHTQEIKIKLHNIFSKGYINNLNRAIRCTSKYKFWRESIYKRDDYTCRLCGKRGGILNAHHSIHLSAIVEEFCQRNNINVFEIKKEDIFSIVTNDIFFDINNGITLCEPCHKKNHKLTGT